MKTLISIFNTIVLQLGNISKPQKDFLSELFEVIFSLYGKGNFINLSRFSKFNECTFRRNFSKFFDWVQFNYLIINMYYIPSQVLIALIDCSFISKSGKKTFGLDKFWSGVSSKALKGLEISVLSLLNVSTTTTWTLDVTQTPGNIKANEGNENEYTRINFYLEQFIDCLPVLRYVTYIVADGFYAKQKVFDTITIYGKHLITKLRNDADLRFLFTGKQKGGQGAHKKYDGKVLYNDLNNWLFEGIDYKYDHLQIYYQTLNSYRFKRDLKVVLVLNTITNKYILLASTDLSQNARQILEYYQLRFQIEFLFRDAKQFTCLNDCQARDEQKLDFHFNMSLSAINLCRVAMIEDKTSSLNDFVRASYNMRFLKFIFSKLSLEAKFEEIDTIYKEIIKYGSMRA